MLGGDKSTATAKTNQIMSNNDDKQSSIRERSQKWACIDGGDNGHSQLSSKDEIAAPHQTVHNNTQSTQQSTIKLK